MSAIRTVIIGTGSHIPAVCVKNDHFLRHDFRGSDQQKISKSNEEIVSQFEAITGIRERRYVPHDLVASDIALDAAKHALQSSGVDPETLDAIIVAHNFGDVRHRSHRIDQVPALAARVKAGLKIHTPSCVAFDILFGCPGWLQGMIIADQMIRAGDAKRAMIIGAETLSRISDPHDRDSLIYADGAGATIVEGRETGERVGILAHAVRSDTLHHSSMLFMGKSYNEEVFLEALFLKMEGRKVYKYAVGTVASGIKDALDKAGVSIGDIAKILIHQANGKMDEAILDALFELYGIKEPSHAVMPMTIGFLGNSSVATVPTMLDLILNGKLEGHTISRGDTIVFASVGAGMHINAAVYRVP